MKIRSETGRKDRKILLEKGSSEKIFFSKFFLSIFVFRKKFLPPNSRIFLEKDKMEIASLESR